ncbi:MAG: HEAT repeat domain-containing protein, partial [Clostridia bacterium]|nr:HEAT repeat domain-containing protein [Clostridia bacterium]
MSIPLLIEIQSEVRRLLIAGSELAIEDFRLKKLLLPVKKAGKSIPIFSKVADSLEKVFDSDNN